MIYLFLSANLFSFLQPKTDSSTHSFLSFFFFNKLHFLHLFLQALPPLSLIISLPPTSTSIHHSSTTPPPWFLSVLASEVHRIDWFVYILRLAGSEEKQQRSLEIEWWRGEGEMWVSESTIISLNPHPCLFRFSPPSCPTPTHLSSTFVSLCRSKKKKEKTNISDCSFGVFENKTAFQKSKWKLKI